MGHPGKPLTGKAGRFFAFYSVFRNHKEYAIINKVKELLCAWKAPIWRYPDDAQSTWHFQYSNSVGFSYLRQAMQYRLDLSLQ